MTCILLLQLFLKGFLYFCLGMGTPLGSWLGLLVTCILLFNFKSFCLFGVTVWDSVRQLIRAVADLHFSPKIAF